MFLGIKFNDAAELKYVIYPFCPDEKTVIGLQSLLYILGTKEVIIFVFYLSSQLLLHAILHLISQNLILVAKADQVKCLSNCNFPRKIYSAPKWSDNCLPIFLTENFMACFYNIYAGINLQRCSLQYLQEKSKKKNSLRKYWY